MLDHAEKSEKLSIDGVFDRQVDHGSAASQQQLADPTKDMSSKAKILLDQAKKRVVANAIDAYCEILNGGVSHVNISLQLRCSDIENLRSMAIPFALTTTLHRQVCLDKTLQGLSATNADGANVGTNLNILQPIPYSSPAQRTEALLKPIASYCGSLTEDLISRINKANADRKED